MRAFFVLSLIVIPGVTLAQTTSGSLRGVVRDASGAVIPGAEVTAVLPATDHRAAATTDALGNYSFHALSPGLYTLRVSIAGFRVETRTSEVHAGENLQVDVQLERTNVTETIQLIEYLPILRTDKGGVRHTADTRTIVSMPLNGRNFIALAASHPALRFHPVQLCRVSMEGGHAPTNICLMGFRCFSRNPGRLPFSPFSTPSRASRSKATALRQSLAASTAGS